MALYEELANIDLITPILKHYELRYTPGGNPVVVLGAKYETTPWIHHRVNQERECSIWTIYHNLFGIVWNKEWKNGSHATETNEHFTQFQLSKSNLRD